MSASPELLDRIAGRTIVASISGGKDSTAMALYLTRELELPGVRFVFADTGWEHPDTYRYIREVLTPLLGHVERVGYPGGMRSLALKKGMFPSRVRRFCTEELKVKPLAAYIKTCGERTINAVGIRAAESAARANQPEWEPADAIYGIDCDVWRPLIRWTEQDVIDCHARHGVVPNPLYLRGASRVGCWPCIFARKKEIEFIADQTPEVIETIRSLEAEVGALAAARYAARGETFESLGYSSPTFFQAQGALRSEGKDGANIPIDRVVMWSRTAHGGKQFELFAPKTEPGCVRWGLCESAQDDGEEAA